MNLKRITLDRRKCNDPIAYIRKQKFQHIKDQCNFEVWSLLVHGDCSTQPSFKEKFHDLTQSNCTIHFDPLKVKCEKTKQTLSLCPVDLTVSRAARCHHRNRREQPNWRFYFNDSTRSWKFQTRSFLICFSFKPNEVFKQRLMGETIKRKNKNCMLTN